MVAAIQAESTQPPVVGPHPMAHRGTARLVGGLYILATAAGVASVLAQQPVADATGYLAAAHRHAGRVATGALLETVMSVAVVAIAIAIHPVLARVRARLALGYVVARAVEAVMYLVGSAGLLTLLALGRPAAADPPPAELGELVRAGRDVLGTVTGAVAFSVSAVILNYLLLRGRLVPRWLSAWGLVGAVSYLVGAVLGGYSPDLGSATQAFLDLPLAVQEMTLAVLLIIRGFAPVDVRGSAGR
jgi:hypothetical protein